VAGSSSTATNSTDIRERVPNSTTMTKCTKCGKDVKPAKGYLGGEVMCNECSNKLVEENTI